jgi:arsenate reductase (thioredoxin)
MTKSNVLFICVHNSARSRMAEAFLNARCGQFFEAQSAGLEGGRGVNPLAAAVMQEVGLDISGKPSQEVFDVYKSGQLFAYVITVCSESESAGCPVFPGATKRLHWPFADPSSFTGTWKEKLEQTRIVRDQIAAKIDAWCAEVCVETAGATP